MFDDDDFYPIDQRVKVVSLGVQPRLEGQARRKALVKALYSFRRAVLKEQPDFVLSFMNKYNVFCLAALTGTNIPVIASERDSPTEEGRRLNWLLRERLYPRARGIITQSRQSQKHLAARGCHNNIAVIDNPIENMSPDQGIKRERVVLSVARLVAKKGHADLLEAFAQVGDDAWTMVICGDGPLRSKLESKARLLRISDRVRFEGTVRDVGSWYARASIFAFTSHFEGFPNALAEAMIAGAAPVSYDCPTGPAELIRHGENGFLVPVGDIDGFARRLREMMADVDLVRRMSGAASTIAARLDASVVAREYFDFCVRSAGVDQLGS